MNSHYTQAAILISPKSIQKLTHEGGLQFAIDMAQVHATLALADEQRTANLIAYREICPDPAALDRLVRSQLEGER